MNLKNSFLGLLLNATSFNPKGYCKVLKAKRYPNVECEGPPKGCRGGSQCSANAKCIDDASSEDKDHLYNCVCKQGFQGDGKVCQRGNFIVIDINDLPFIPGGISNTFFISIALFI